MNILVFGKTGQVATELAGFDGVTCVGRDVADLSNPQACAGVILNGNFDAVINAAAYTAVDKAECEEAQATVINGDAPKAMAEACAGKKIPFIHISTDYVFEGGGEKPWKPSDPTNPQNAYARSKLIGENAVIKAGGVYAILRTSWVFSTHGKNFVNTMLRLGAERDMLNIVGDQIGGPTQASALASACYKIAHELIETPNKAGVYHLSGAPNCSWADFAREIFNVAAVECEVNDIKSSEYPTPATRPLNSRMDCSLTKQVFGIEQPNWRDALPSGLPLANLA